MSEMLMGAKDTHGVGVELELEAGSITPKEIWEMKDEFVAFCQKSKGEWDKMSNEQRESVIRLVKSGIERIYDRVDEWVPESMATDGGNYLDVHFRLLFTDIDEEIQRNEEATSFQIKNAKDEVLAKLASDIDGDGDEGDE